MPGTINDFRSLDMIDDHNEASSLLTSRPEDHKETKRRLPRRSFCQLLRHGCQQFALDFAFSCESAIGSPLLLEIGIPLELYGVCWLFGPILGFVLGPMIGSWSDDCTASWGRRRPFLLVLNILVIVSAGCYLNVTFISSEGWEIAVALIGISLVDLSAFLTESSSRAYLLDVCDVDDVTRGLSIRTVLGGLGCGTAFLVCGIDWASTSFGAAVGGNNEVIFLFTLLVYLVCASLSMTSIAEEPLVAHGDKVKNEYVAMTEINGGEPRNSIDEAKEPTSIKDRISSIIFLPNCLRLLCVTHFFSWSAFVTFILFFTDYFAQQVAGGVPTAPLNSTAYERYDEGLRYGSFGLCIFGFSTALLSPLFLQFSKCFSLKTLYIALPLLSSACFGAMALLSDYATVTLILCVGASILFVAITTIPYDILNAYHTSETYTHPENGPVRGLGTDMGVLYAMVFLCQAIISVVMGPLVAWIRSELTVVVTAALFAFISVICACFVTYKI